MSRYPQGIEGIAAELEAIKAIAVGNQVGTAGPPGPQGPPGPVWYYTAP